MFDPTLSSTDSTGKRLGHPASDRTIGRLSLYRRLVDRAQAQGKTRIFSHELATLAGVTAAQVRRDLMAVSVTGSPKHGYDVAELVAGIGRHLDGPRGQRIALAGVGHLGRAMLSYFFKRRPDLEIVAAFDAEPEKTGRLIHGCHTYPVEQIEEVVAREGITVGIVAVPAAAAQSVTDRLVRAGVSGIVNFAPVALRVPPHVFVEDLDVTMALERVAYFARAGRASARAAGGQR